MILIFLLLLLYFTIIQGSFEKKKRRYAFATLLMMGDSYLPGVVLLGESIRSLYGKDERIFDIVCMVTEDVSDEAITVIKKIYDKVVKVPYLDAVSDVNLNLTKSDRKGEYLNICKHSLTKIYINLLKYEKVFYSDADTIIFTKKFEEIFKYDTPGGFVFSDVTVANIRYIRKPFKGKISLKYRQKHKIFMEATVYLFSPDIKIFDKFKEFIIKNPKSSSLDAFAFSNFYDVFTVIDRKYFSRFYDKKIYMLDMHGSDFKPWDSRAQYYCSIWYAWATIYNLHYRNKFIKFNNRILDNAFKVVNNAPRVEMPIFYTTINDYLNERDAELIRKEIQHNYPNTSRFFWLAHFVNEDPNNRFLKNREKKLLNFK